MSDRTPPGATDRIVPGLAARPSASLLIASTLLVLLVESPRAQQEPLSTAAPREPAATVSSARTSFTTVLGRVVDSHGVPIAGAVVVTDAGGRAVADAAGGFTLQLELAQETRTLHVTAAATSHGCNLTGTRSVGLQGAGAVVSLGPVTVEQLATCQPSWLPLFGGEPGVSAEVHAMAIFDEGRGDGPVLFVGGNFSVAGGVPVPGLAKWDGLKWTPVGDGSPGSVQALTVWDDGSGSGPALFIGAGNVVKWDGVRLTSLGTGVASSLGSPVVFSLAVHDDGSGPALIAGGFFNSAGGLPALSVAKWDGSAWSALGSGLGGGFGPEVDALVSFDDGHGPALFAGGNFVVSGAVAVGLLARWDGTAWSAVGGGVNSQVYALTVYDDPLPGGPALYATGNFSSAGVTPAKGIAKWDGTNWSALGGGLSGSVRALAAWDDGTGSALYAAGNFNKADGLTAHKVARWNGTTWTALGDGLATDASTFALAVFDDGLGGGPSLFAGGYFDTAEGKPALNIARWGGAAWSALGKGFSDSVATMLEFDDGSGEQLYIAGSFAAVNGVAQPHIVRWDGASLSGVGGGLDGAASALAIYDDGTGPALFAAGDFTHAGGVAANRVAKWNGSSWSALGSGLSGPVSSMAVWDDGTGPALYVGGAFANAGGAPAKNVARWDGSAWSPLGTGTNIDVFALTVYDDAQAGGPALFAGGFFTTAGGVTARGLARWNGSAWSAVGSGLGTGGVIVEALGTFDDGTGPALYVGGQFTVSHGAPADNLARWNGATWSAIDGAPHGDITALGTHDDGSGPALYAGGIFSTAGGAPAFRIARWDGSTWSALGSGAQGLPHVFRTFDDGHGSALYVGGDIAFFPDTDDSHLSRWACPQGLWPWSDLGGGLAGSAGVPALVGTGPLLAGSTGAIELSGAKAASLAALYVSLTSSPAPFKGGTLFTVPVALTFDLMTSAAGSLSLAWADWPPGIPPGSTLFFQCAIQDAGAPKGLALSNGLEAVTP